MSAILAKIKRPLLYHIDTKLSVDQMVLTYPKAEKVMSDWFSKYFFTKNSDAWNESPGFTALEVLEAIYTTDEERQLALQHEALIHEYVGWPEFSRNLSLSENSDRDILEKELKIRISTARALILEKRRIYYTEINIEAMSRYGSEGHNIPIGFTEDEISYIEQSVNFIEKVFIINETFKRMDVQSELDLMNEKILELNKKVEPYPRGTSPVTVSLKISIDVNLNDLFASIVKLAIAAYVGHSL